MFLKRMAEIVGVSTLAGLTACALWARAQNPSTKSSAITNGRSRQTTRSPVTFSTTLQWLLRRELVETLSANVKPGPKVAAPHVATASKQPATFAMSSRTPMTSSEQTLLAHGATSQTTAIAQNAGRSGIPMSPVAVSRLCAPGIVSVSGKKTAVVFTPIGGPYGIYVVQGCGFGSQPGEVYLSNLKYPQKINLGSISGPAIPVRLNPDQLQLQIAPNGWSDRQIITHIDPNASGYYDTDPVTLVVKTAGGQEYKSGAGTGPSAAKYSFSAARAPQLLMLTQLSAYDVDVGSELDSNGKYPSIYVGSSAPSLFPGTHSVVVVKQDVGASFSEGYRYPDHFNVLPAMPGVYGNTEATLMDGFEITVVQMYTAGLPLGSCVYAPPGSAQLTTAGNWTLTTPGDGYDVSWQTQTCTTISKLMGTKIESVSAYALDITVWGPRGVSPWKFLSGYQ